MDIQKADDLRQEIVQLKDNLHQIYTGKIQPKENVLILSHRLMMLYSRYKLLLEK